MHSTHIKNHGSVSPVPGIEPGFEDRVRRQRGSRTPRRNQGGSYAKAAFHSVKFETAQLNRQFSNDTQKQQPVQWPPLPTTTPPVPPTPNRIPLKSNKDEYLNTYNEFAPDTVPYGIGQTVSNATLRAAFGSSPIFHSASEQNMQVNHDDQPDRAEEELEMMKSLSLVEMLHVMGGGDIPKSRTPSPIFTIQGGTSSEA